MRVTGIDHVQLAMPAGQEEIANSFEGRLSPRPPSRQGQEIRDFNVHSYLGGLAVLAREFFFRVGWMSG